MGKIATFFEGFWPFIARVILRNRVWCIAGILLLTGFFYIPVEICQVFE
jgi:hypothetical protein